MLCSFYIYFCKKDSHKPRQYRSESRMCDRR